MDTESFFKVAEAVAGLAQITKLSPNEFLLTVKLENLKTPLTCEMSLEEFGFADLKEKRIVLNAEMNCTAAAIKDLVESANPFLDPWFAEQNARLSMNEEFISITLPAEINQSRIDQSVQRLSAIRESLCLSGL